jgi:hypothetical protein
MKSSEWDTVTHQGCVFSPAEQAEWKRWEEEADRKLAEFKTRQQHVEELDAELREQLTTLEQRPDLPSQDDIGQLEPVAVVPHDAREATAASPPQQESEHSPPARSPPEQNPQQRVKSREAIARAYGRTITTARPALDLFIGKRRFPERWPI